MTIIHVWCNCNNQQPEEVKRGVYVCLNCNNDINPSDFTDDFSEAPDIIDSETMNAEYEYSRENDITNDRPL